MPQLLFKHEIEVTDAESCRATETQDIHVVVTTEDTNGIYITVSDVPAPEREVRMVLL